MLIWRKLSTLGFCANVAAFTITSILRFGQSDSLSAVKHESLLLFFVSDSVTEYLRTGLTGTIVAVHTETDGFLTDFRDDDRARYVGLKGVSVAEALRRVDGAIELLVFGR
jgi:hypothetical protein